MIDTIGIRIHECKEEYIPCNCHLKDIVCNHTNGLKKNVHYEVMNFLKQQTPLGFDSFTRMVNLEEWQRTPSWLQVDYYQKYDGKEDVIMKLHRNKIPIGELDSSHYLCTYSINFIKDYIEFNFSIPKFLYGNNIAQFVTNIWNDKHHIQGLSDEIKNQEKILFDRFVKFMNDWRQKVFGELKIDWERVELNRIDLCFNQLFDSKDEALEYLEYQKRIKKRNSRSTSDNLKGGSYETGIHYKTKSWSFKIYHKGSEYSSQKGDMSKHRQLNKLNGKELFPVNKFKSISDRILRYEVTYRPQRISQLYRAKLFRKDSRSYRADKRIYKKYHSMTKGGMTFQVGLDREGNITNEVEKIRKYKNILTREEKKHYDTFKKHLQRVNKFMLKVPKKIKEHEQKNNMLSYIYYNQVHFSKELLYLLLDDFKKVIREYEIKKKDKLGTIKEKVENHNKELYAQKEIIQRYPKESWSKTEKVIMNKSGFNVSRMIQLMTNLQFMTLEQMKEKGYITKKAYERYKGQLKELGIDTRNQSYSEVTFNAPFDFSKYNMMLLNNQEVILNSWY